MITPLHLQTPGHSRASGVWVHLLLLAGAEVVFATVLLIINKASPSLGYFLRSGLGIFVINLLNGILMLTLVGAFLAVKDRSDVLKGLLLTRPGFSAVACPSFVCGCLAFALLQFQRRTGITALSHLERAIQASGETGPAYFALLALIGPLFEEMILRGYFYSKFRQAYSVVGSVAILTGIAVLLHISAVSTAPTAFVGITVLTIVMCLSLEFSHTTWACIVGHAVYNAVCVFG